MIVDEVKEIFGEVLDGGVDVGAAAKDHVNAVIDRAAEKSGEIPTTTPMTSLASYVMSRFQENADHRDRSGTTDRLNYCLKAQKCVFSERQKDTLVRLFGNQEIVDKIFVPITAVKNRAAKSMLIDLVNQGGDPLFHLEPTPSPDVPEEISQKVIMKTFEDIQKLFSMFQQQGVQQLPDDVMAKVQEMIATVTERRYDDVKNAEDAYARDRSKRLERKVWDIMEEGGWNEAFMSYIDNLCVYGTAVVIGPVVKNVPKSECRRNRQSGVMKFRRTIKGIPTFESVNPLDCYPAPDAQKVDDGAFCVTVKYTADSLWQFAKASKSSDYDGTGWLSPTVMAMLERHPRGGVHLDIRQYNSERRYCEGNGFNDTNDCTFEGVRCFASVRGSELIDMGVTKNRDKKRIDAETFYKTETVVIDNRIVYCRIFDDATDFPICKGTFYSCPGCWWGDSIAEKVAMCQTVLNNCIKSMLQNMTNSAGPVWWVNDVQRLADKSPGALKMHSGKTVPFLTSMVGNSGAPIGAISVPSTANELLLVWKQMQTQADLDSGIPAFTEGQSSGQTGALRTASGLAQYSEHSMRGMKMVMTGIDKDFISRSARLTADWVMINDDDMTLKGDVSVRSVGLIGKVLKVQRDQQRLQVFNMALQSQVLQQIVGVRGLVELFRPSLVDLDINPDDVMPSKGKMEELEAIQGIKQVFEATSAANGVQQNAAQEQQGGAVPGVEQPPQVQGGVAERRAVA